MNKDIRLTGVFSMAAGAMISSGIFILPSLAFAQLGPAVSLAYLIAGLFAFMGCFSVMELATAMPKDGGDYYYIHKTFGGFIGSISGIFGWFALSLKSAFAIFGISEVLLRFFGISPTVSGLLLCGIFVLLNSVGTKEAMLLQNLLVAALLILLVLYSVFGIILGIQISMGLEGSQLAGLQMLQQNWPESWQAQSRLAGLWRALQEGFHPRNLSSQSQLLALLSISGFVFVSFGGLLKITNISGEVANPKRNLPLGMSLSIIVVTILYTVINVILVAVMPAEALRESLAPVADSALLILSYWGRGPAQVAYYAIMLASLLAFITTANAGIMAASRYPMALSRDKLLPPWLGRLHSRFQTPVAAIVLTGIIIAVSLFLPLLTLVKAASAVVLSSYILTNLAVIVFRESRVTNYRPSFSSPLYPWLQILSIAVFSFFIIDIGTQVIGVSIFFLFLGIAIYYFYGRKHSSRSFALVYLLRRIVDRHLEQDNLEQELLDVVLHRDEIQLDIFQELAQRATIQDIPYAMTFANMLKASCRELARQAGLPPEQLEDRFLLRQAEGTTAFSPFLAIPHFITPDECPLFMQIVRCKEGIYFDEQHSEVKAIFLLGGGPEKRREHLECLAAIATIAGQVKGFEQDWLAAGNVSELRNLILSLDSARQLTKPQA